MATVEQVANASLKLILAQAADAPLEPDEYNDYIFALNNWMLAMDASGIHLGYTAVDSLSDIVTVPDGALLGIIANVAIDVAPSYSGKVMPALVLSAKTGLGIMRKLGSRVIPSHFPSTLPIGTGNQDNGFGHSKFYPGDVASILAETYRVIQLESGTEAAL